MANGINMIFKL